MKGVIYTGVGSPDNLKIEDIERPRPKKRQLLIKVEASSISNMEYMRFGTKLDGRPKILFPSIINLGIRATGKPLGVDVSGIVEEVGADVKAFKEGDEVFGLTANFIGGWAEYALLDEKSACKKPPVLSFVEAATMPTACITALGAVRAARVCSGQKVLVHGASGGVGHFVVQIAKAFGAEVTGVCSTRNLDVVRSIGADHVIDYKKGDISKITEMYDAIIVINGYNSMDTYRKLLKPGGRCVLVGGIKQAAVGSLGAPFYSIISGRKFTPVGFPMMPTKRYLEDIADLANNSNIKPFIDQVFSPYNAGDAIKYVIETHPQGKVALNLDF